MPPGAAARLRDVEFVEMPVKQILNRCTSSRMPFRWTINPYRGCEFGCVYCYARYTHEFLELRDPMDFERRIFVKRMAAEVLQHTLSRTPLGHDQIAIGTATDPYQPAERKFALTRAFRLHQCFGRTKWPSDSKGARKLFASGEAPFMARANPVDKSESKRESRLQASLTDSNRSVGGRVGGSRSFTQRRRCGRDSPRTILGVLPGALGGLRRHTPWMPRVYLT
jgi:hypothetical protein